MHIKQRIVVVGPALFAGLLAGCAQEQSPVSNSNANDSTALISTAAAPKAPGDVAPSQLYARAPGEVQGPGRVSVSSPVSPRQVLQAPAAPETRRFKSTVIHVAPRSPFTRVEVPIDAPEDAWVLLIPKGDNTSQGQGQGEAVLREVTLRDPTGQRTDQRAAREANLELGKSTDTAQQRTAEIRRPVSFLKLDQTSRRGVYTLDVGSKALVNGLTVEVRQPNSSIELGLTPSALQLFPGDGGYVTVHLAAADPIERVRFEAVLYTPAYVRERTVPVVRVGDEYRAQVGNVLGERDPTGNWILEVRAIGASGGQRFDRLGQTAFGFAVPTARIISAGRARLVREGRQVTGLLTDVVIESQATDRYEVSATLVATDSQGVERPVAEAQVTDQLAPGKHTLTLRFDAGHAALTKLDGSYGLRDLRLFALGSNTMVQRAGRGLDLRFPAVRLADLRPAEKTPAIEALLRQGDLEVSDR